ncbi:MAG: flagellar hook-associated protein FlgK [Sphingobium sp.]|uniref:flagellar hook-associated protein FlgK n=1 Tax=Sphingobium sp. TaxID=1912891 RepID=UPI0029AC6DA6|nr:flagellar hook-associated protein FlgK [Sphingobium sp.]MDX3909314.1 flagellar hook-associated protein FlgK [Sphingobium sp.]
MSGDLFIIGASGTKAYRAAMGAISENITNANTPNFNRRSVSTRESLASASTMLLYAPQTSFGGVDIARVNRANDPYLDATARLTGTALGSVTSRLRWQSDIETALDDSDTGVGHLLSDMFGGVEKLAANPADPSLRTTLVYNMQRVVDAFHQSADGIKQSQTGIATDAGNDVQTINNALAELSRINTNLLRSQDGSANQAQLLDSRDAALSQITQRMDVTIAFGARGSVELSYAGTTILSGGVPSTFSVNQNADKTLSLSHEGTAIAAPGTGSLGGLFQSATVARDRLASLDSLAQKFVTDLNTWHGQGTIDGTVPGGALFSGTTATNIALVITDGKDIATRSSDGRLNGNLLNISSVRGTAGVEQGWTAIIAAHANLLNATSSEFTATQKRDEQARGARENVSGIDLDAEAADLLRVQQAYSGCAKIIQVARETVDAILQIM